MSKEKYIHKELVKSSTPGESTSVRMRTKIKDGSSELIISHTITERFAVQDYDKVMELKERLTNGEGRRFVSLDEIAGAQTKSRYADEKYHPSKL